MTALALQRYACSRKEQGQSRALVPVADVVVAAFKAKAAPTRTPVTVWRLCARAWHLAGVGACVCVFTVGGGRLDTPVGRKRCLHPREKRTRNQPATSHSRSEPGPYSTTRPQPDPHLNPPQASAWPGRPLQQGEIADPGLRVSVGAEIQAKVGLEVKLHQLESEDKHSDVLQLRYGQRKGGTRERASTPNVTNLRIHACAGLLLTESTCCRDQVQALETRLEEKNAQVHALLLQLQTEPEEVPAPPCLHAPPHTRAHLLRVCTCACQRTRVYEER